MGKTLEAKRVVRGTRPFVEVLVDGKVIGRAGGKRAERAQVAMVLIPEDGRPKIHGLRANPQAAFAEARRAAHKEFVMTWWLDEDGNRHVGGNITEWKTARAEGRIETETRVSSKNIQVVPVQEVVA